MKIIFALVMTWALFAFTGCSSTPLEKKREQILDCTKDLIGYEAYPVEAYQVCRDLHSRQPRKQEGRLQ